MFTGFNFSGGSGNRYYPAGFSNKTPSDGVAASVSCSYDGTAIPNDGYPFEYTTTAPQLGNAPQSGVSFDLSLDVRLDADFRAWRCCSGVRAPILRGDRSRKASHTVPRQPFHA